MHVQQNDALANELLDEMMEDDREDRTRMHPSVTDLIGCLTKSYYDMSADRPTYTDQTKVFFLIGLGLERALLVKRKGKPTYGETDGIHWHVDSLDNGLLELKSTRANPAKGEEGFSERWLKQIKSYLNGIGETVTDLAVVYLIQAQFKVYRLTFETHELKLHHMWMMGRKKIWDEAVKEGVSPKAFSTNEDWECKNCAYKLICETKSRMGL